MNRRPKKGIPNHQPGSSWCRTYLTRASPGAASSPPQPPEEPRREAPVDGTSRPPTGKQTATRGAGSRNPNLLRKLKLVENYLYTQDPCPLLKPIPNSPTPRRRWRVGNRRGTGAGSRIARLCRALNCRWGIEESREKQITLS